MNDKVNQNYTQEVRERILAKAKIWAENNYFDLESRKEIQDLIDQSQNAIAFNELFDRFYKDIEFGTGGLRCVMGMGSNRMSKYIVRRATYALAQTVDKYFAKNGGELRIAISYDSRRFSDLFAREAASVIAGSGAIAYIFDRLNPTPLLSFSVRYLHAHAGIMITASHNPPAYNGYKVYWNDGAQVVPPCDKEIIDAYYGIDDFNKIPYVPFEDGIVQGRIRYMGREIEDAYQQVLRRRYFHFDLAQKQGGELKIVFTPIHGTGYIPCLRALSDLGMKSVRLVQEQISPDADFSTVPSPNPEDPRALKLAVDLMEREQADIVFGTDPDADRIGVVVRSQARSHFLNGNQVGVLMLYYMLSNLKERGELSVNSLMIKSIVTSEMQTAVAKHFGMEMRNTLTGFKWMCALWNFLQKQDPKLPFVMASEESYGYLLLSEVRDKDAVSATAMLAEMALWYKLKGMTLVDLLDRLYCEIGFFDEGLLNLDYYGVEGEQKIKRIMELFRNYKHPTLGDEKIVKVEDYLQGEEREIADGNVLKVNQLALLNTPTSNVLGFTLESGSKIYLRPSGTEPKIKFYFLIHEMSDSASASARALVLAQQKMRAKQRIEFFANFFREAAEKV
ncbi:MAG: phospho-sugar mutase [Oligoflexia bacterium]|nr:phospho-sugar mutase [Oligoflexia bacterium]